ncbi:MAG: InlB B-repeat-containing protein, partial [Christensenellales bacterium]
IASGSHGNISLYAKFALNRYAITYDTQGGVNAVGNKTEYTIEDGNIALCAPVRNYYDFAGWYENGVLVESISATRLCDINLVAEWTAVEYTISYDLNGGTCEDTLVTKYTVESEDIILPTLSKDGYIFAGWYDGDVKVEKIASGSHGDIALLAKWASATYSVTYVCDGEHSNPAELNVGDDYTLKDAQKTGYSFEGWYGDQSYSDRVYVLTSSGESVTVYAKFEPVVYTITYDYDGGTGVENPTTYTVESEDIMLCDATKDGFEFAGWFDQDVKVEKIAKGSHGNLSLVAKWIENSPFVVEGSEIVGYTGSDTHIVLPSKVGDVQITSIGADVFQSVASCVEIIEIEEGITTIAQGVFFNLTKLRIVSLPSTITQMPQKAFKDCVLLEEMTLPFVGATKYKNDEFVGTGKYAYSFSYVFDGFADTSLGSKVDVSAIRFAKDGTNEELTFSEVAYVPTSLKKVTILDGDLIVYAFKNCANIEQIVVKGGGTVVEKQAFAKCTNLASVELAGGFESFGTACFSASGLQTITVQNETQKTALLNSGLDLSGITVSVASTLA